MDPAELPGLTFEFHPSVSVVRSAYPIIKIWAMNAGELPLEPIESWDAENALVTRPELNVLVHALPKGGAEFLTALFNGEKLEAAFEEALRTTNDFDLTGNLACLFRMGAVIRVA